MRRVPTEAALRGTVLVDFESRSRASLKKVGGRLYWQYPSTEAICAVLYSTRTGERWRWYPGDPTPNLEIAAAHNAMNFDRFAAAACGWSVLRWVDTSHYARRAGLPGKLDALAKEWLGRDKDHAGNKVTLALSRPSRAKATKGELPELTCDVRKRVLAYCADDVEILEETWDRLKAFADVDADTAEADRAVNDRGVYLDVPFVKALQVQVNRLQDEAVAKGAKALGMSEADARRAARSVPQFTAMTGLPNAQMATLEAATTKHPLIAVRRALASVVPGKLAAALLRVSPDSRLRDSEVYYGAHAQPLSEPVHTPCGWTTMGSLRVGSIISGSAGAVRVSGIYPQGVRRVFRVTMSDGASVRCDADHLWLVYDRRGARWATLKTSEIGSGLALRRACGRYRYRVPLVSAVAGRGALPLDPYTLGALLGDGCMVGKTPRFTSGDPEIAAQFVLPAGVYLVVRDIPDKKAKHYRLSSGVGGRWRRNPLRVKLEALDLWGRDSFTKFIPVEYLNAPDRDRLALLQGLLDTDGTARSAGVAKYTTCSADLRDGVVSLVRSLGGVARVRTEPLNGREIYSVECRLPADRPAFRLRRKLLKHKGPRRAPSRSITAIEPEGEEECQCIRVDAADHLYVTRDYVLTHNTGRWSQVGVQLHNLPRGTFEKVAEIAGVSIEEYLHAAQRHAARGGDLTQKEVSVLLRSMLSCPPGKRLAVLDYAGIEARVNAWSAGDEDALEVFRAFDEKRGPDPYRKMALKIWPEDGTPEGVSKDHRSVGKQAELGCFAADTLVLTERGWVGITAVRSDDRVWDGCEWVQHDGVIARGQKPTVDLSGVAATAEHPVWLGRCGWCRAESLARNESILCQGLDVASGLLPSEVFSLPTPEACEAYWLSVRAVALSIESTSAICEAGAARGASYARSAPPEPIPSVGGSMRTCAQTTGTAHVSSTGSARSFSGALMRNLAAGVTTAAAALQYTARGLEIVLGFFATCSPSMGGTCQSANSTGQTMTPGTDPAISASYPSRSMPAISAASALCSGGSASLRPVFDIANAGPRHRFAILTRRGPLIVHNCGYQMGGDKFDDTCAKAGVNLAAAGVDSDDVVAAWRGLHAPIVRSWKNCTAGFVGACNGKTVRVGPWTYMPLGERDIACFMPSGRPIVYRKATARRVQRRTKDGRSFAAWDLKYYGQKQGRWTWIHAYGGLLVENNVQATSRDLLADALVRCEADGLNPVLHVHDELVCETDRQAASDALEHMREIMANPPDWADGIPMKLDGFTDTRYRK